MIAVEAVTEIEQDRTLRIGLPHSVKPGSHRVFVVIEEAILAEGEKLRGPLRLAKLNLAGWPADCTFRREDIDGDTGR